MTDRGVTFAIAARLALALPGVEIGTSWGTPSLKVKGRFLARLKEDGETLVLRIGIARREELLKRAPAVFYVTDHYLHYPAVLIRLPKVRRTVLGDLLREAWTAVAPESLIAGSKAVPARRSGKQGRGRERR